jgi:hypothetical protein
LVAVSGVKIGTGSVYVELFGEVLLIDNFTLVGCRDMLFTRDITVREHVANFVLSAREVALIIAVPFATDVTKPVVLTVATAGFELVQSTVFTDTVAGAIVAIIDFIVFTSIIQLVGLIITVVTAADTVTVIVPVLFDPSVDVAVIIAVPDDTPVTTPFTTVAILEFDVLHVRFFIALVGNIVGIGKVSVPIIPIAAVLGLNTILVTAVITVREHVANFVLSAREVAVIIAVPFATDVTKPAVLTVATEGFELVQSIVFTITVAGAIVAIIDFDVLTSIIQVEGLIVTLVTAADTVTVTVAVLFDPSVDVAVIIAVPADTPVTTPFTTVAILEFDVLHVRVFVALTGNIVGIGRVSVRATPTVAVLGLNTILVTPVTTVIVQVVYT